MSDVVTADLTTGTTRRRLLQGAAAAGLLSLAAPVLVSLPAQAATAATPDGTPEQIHLQWGSDPATTMTVSWASVAQSMSPRVVYGLGGGAKTEATATQRTYTDGLTGVTVFTYHVALTGLSTDATYDYSVLSGNSSASSPFASSFTTAPSGRSKFRFTSYGDLATNNTDWVLSYPQAAFAVGVVEEFKPLFHLLNGDLCYANLNPAHQDSVWRDFGNNNQSSAANRPWMPCLGNHEVEFNNGPQGYDSYLTRYTLPGNSSSFSGNYYAFRVGSVLFISLDSDDVIYQDGAAFNAGPAPLQPAASTGNAAIPAGTSFYNSGYSGGAQTRWLEQTLAAARSDTTIDWIVVQMHQDALSSSANGNGSDLGIRTAWLPLFDKYSVDVVVCGHDHDYERSFPVRGADANVGRKVSDGSPVDTQRPKPATTTDTVTAVDTSKGTVHLILGGGGTSAPLDQYGVDTANNLPQAKLFTQRNAPQANANGNGGYFRAGADAVEDAIWSARRDPQTGYGIAVFDVDPGTAPGGPTTMTMSYYHATGADPATNASKGTGDPVNVNGYPAGTPTST